MLVQIRRIAYLICALTAGAPIFAHPALAEEAKPVVTFNNDVLPILQKNCQSCHRPGQIGPFSMLTYKDTRPFAKAIKTAVTSRTMPPWFADPHYGHFINDRSLKQAEIDAIAAWVDSGAPEGEAKDAPAPIQWPGAGWQVKPDVVVEFPPFDVPARGVLDWMTLVIPAPFKEDTWITSMEILPGEPAVVHHACWDFYPHKATYMYNTYEWSEIPRDQDGIAQKKPAAPQGTAGAQAAVVGGEGGGQFTQPDAIVVTREVGSTVEKRRLGKPVNPNGGIFCYLPGLTLEDYRPMNAAYFLPAGSDLAINLHYTTNGLAVTDRTRIGFTVAKTPPAKQFIPQTYVPDPRLSVVTERAQSQTDIAIPPYDANYAAPPTVITFNKDIELVTMRPHAHVRGKSATYTLKYPDGHDEIELKVPRYDFNWQLSYATSVKVPKGSKMTVQFNYDNSPSNRYNPDPSKWVYYGQQSWEEMGTPFVGFLIDRTQ
jgi:hypothetical protein